MEDQVLTEVGHAPTVRRLFVDDPLFERVREIYHLIECQAYELFESGGGTHGSDREHWLYAESQILHPIELEVTETETGITVRAEVPGFGAKNLEIAVAPRHLLILGDRQDTSERSERKTARSAHLRNLILGTLELSTKVDPERVQATVDDGLLEVTLPRHQAAIIPALAKAASA